MIRRGMIERVIIICGSSDISLRSQLELEVKGNDDEDNPIPSAADVYQDLRAEEYPEERLPRSVVKNFKNVKVFFSQDLKKKLPSVGEKTLIIHDESHTAQSKENIPFKKFYKENSLDLALQGDYSQLIEKGNFILGVSATPFSEIVANKKVQTNDWTEEELSFMQGDLESKNFHLMQPGQGYIGVSDLLRVGAIKFEASEIKSKSQDIEHIASVLRINSERYNKKYVVIRTHRAEKDKEMMETIARVNGYSYEPIFGGSDKGLDFMNRIPEKGTVVHICGRFRMGQVVPKRNIAMVYEQSKDPNADTILQGLVGRMCGYISKGAHTDVDIYVSPKSQEWIEKYDHAWSTNQIDTLSEISKAMNLGGTKRKNGGEIVTARNSEYIKTVPIKFNLGQLERGFEGQTRFSQITAQSLHYLLTPSDDPDYTSHPELIEDNPDKDEILSSLEILKRGIKVKGKDKDKPHHNRESCHSEFRPLYEEATALNRRSNFTSYAQSEIQFSVYGGNDDGVCYLLGFVPYDPIKHGPKKIEMAAVNPKCNFIPSGEITTEDNSVLDGINGAQLIKFDWNTSEDPDILREELSKAITRSKRDPSVVRSIQSIFDKKTNGFAGIVLSKEIYNEPMIQEIKQELNELHEVKLLFKRSKGRQPKDFIRYASISW